MARKRLPPGTHGVAFAAAWLEMSVPWVNARAVEHGLGEFEGRQRRFANREIRRLEELKPALGGNRGRA